jgi:response regulator RpfG family c-di-GMP phosphodiesterase
MENDDGREGRTGDMPDSIEELKRIISKNEARFRETVRTLKETRTTVRKNYHGMVELLITVISLGNRFLGGHLKRCAQTTWDFCRELRIPNDVCDLLYYGALLHDLGMVGRDPRLTAVPSEQLSDEELQEFRNHPVYGEKIISSIYNLKRTAAVIRSHHERFDGKGFPDQLHGNSIPFGARVIRICNDWDNLLYKYGMSFEDAVEHIRSGAGSLYDPKITENFLIFIASRSRDGAAESSIVEINELRPGMFLKEDIVLSNGLLLVPHGVVLDTQTLEKIESFTSMIGENRRVQVVF